MNSPILTAWPPRLTVAALIARNDRFLLVEENIEGQLVYNQPAGHIEPNETTWQAVCRETLEETGWSFIPSALIGIYFYKIPETGVTYQRICFSGEIQDHLPQQSLDEGIVRTVWLSRNELLAVPHKLRSPMVLKCIDDHLAQKHYPIELITDFSLA